METNINKEKILNRLRKTENKDVWSTVKKVLDLNEDGRDFWFDLSEEDKAHIKVGLADIKAGRTKPAKEVLKKYL
jgi:hypothetical protein